MDEMTGWRLSERTILAAFRKSTTAIVDTNSTDFSKRMAAPVNVGRQIWIARGSQMRSKGNFV